MKKCAKMEKDLTLSREVTNHVPGPQDLNYIKFKKLFRRWEVKVGRRLEPIYTDIDSGWRPLNILHY